ncbi:MAG: Uncharacterised protein [Crocinitomicaceae bacterium]|nr:MAG: Uncharacterised protein [Crocinitomicaceae bacterium]
MAATNTKTMAKICSDLNLIILILKKIKTQNVKFILLFFKLFFKLF